MYCDLGGHSCGDAQQLVVADRDYVVRVPAHSPYLVATKGYIDDRAQLLRVAHGGDAARGLCNPRRGAWASQT